MRGLRGVCGDMPSVGERMTPDPRARDAAGGTKVVPTVWAQRAVNALEAARGGAGRLVVDGVAGPRTIAALEAIRLRMLSGYHPIPTDPAVIAMPQIIDRGHLSLSRALHERLAGAVRIADPSGSTVAECSWSEPASVTPARDTGGGGTSIGPELDPRPSNADTGWDWIPVMAGAAGLGLGVITIAAFFAMRGGR